MADEPDATATPDPGADRPFATVALIVVATQAFYLFQDLKQPDPEVWPLWGLVAGAAAWLFLRPASLHAAGFRRPRPRPELVALALGVVATLAVLGVGALLGSYEVAPGVNRMAPDLIGELALRLACLYLVALLGDELAFRSILQSEAIRRHGAWIGVVLVSAFYAVYRLPLAIRMGLVDVQPDSFEVDRLGLVLLRGALDGLALGLLFRLGRNLFVTAAFSTFLVAMPALFLGNAEEALEPMWFLLRRGEGFDAVLWASAVASVIALAIATARTRPADEHPEVRTPEWLTRNASFTPGADTPTDP